MKTSSSLPWTRSLLTLLTGLSLLFTSACRKETPDGAEPELTPASTESITQYASEKSEYSILSAAMSKADMATPLASKGSFTVFLPTNQAFQALPAPFNSATNIAAITDPAQLAILDAILRYHVLDSRKLFRDFPAGSSSQTTIRNPSASGVNDNTLYFSKGGGKLFINGSARVIIPDIRLSNGVIHVIDKLLVSPMGSVAELASKTPDLSVLVEALKRPAAVDLLTAAASTSANLTVFAPTNAAFASLLEALKLPGLSQVPDATLVAVLKGHIVNGTRAFSTDLTDKQVITTLNGDVTIGVTSAGVTVLGAGNGGNASKVVLANVFANNGVAHVIDRVLLPNPGGSGPGTGTGTIVQVAAANPDFSTLVAAVTKANLASALSGTGPFTVFAPTNAAFAQLPAPFNSAASIAAISDPAQIKKLAGILQYHVLSSNKKAADFPTGSSSQRTIRPLPAPGENDPANDYTIYLSKGAAGLFINGTTKVVTPDVAASNGTIHVIDKVLMPPSGSILVIAFNTPAFSTLVKALQRPAAQELLLAVLNTGNNLTLFAPTNDAFAALLKDLGLSSLSQVPDATLVAVLKGHVVKGTRAFSTDLSDNQSVTTLNGNVKIGVTGAKLTVLGPGNNGNASNISPADVLADNGVIHVIDRVLLPK